MATSPVAVSTAPAANGSANKDAQLIGKIVKLWADEHTRSLAVRRETGSLLNARLGSPAERQPRGQSVLKQAADKLHIAESELNRMRWFAHLSQDEKSCWGEVPPGSRTWTKFKEILPDLIAASKGNEKRKRSSGEGKSPAVVDGLLRLISSATSKLRTDEFTVDETKREKLIEGLQDLLSAVSHATGVRFHLETEAPAGDRNKASAEFSHQPHLALLQCPADTATA